MPSSSAFDGELAGYPAPGTLPKLRLPILASVGSLSATAPHMRLELAKMIKDNVDNNEMRVATPKEGEDPFAPYPFASASDFSTPPSPPAPSGSTMRPHRPRPLGLETHEPHVRKGWRGVAASAFAGKS